MSNADIAEVVGAANSGEIQLAQLALQKSTNPGVQGFAREMIAEHTAANSQVATLMPSFGVSSANVITSVGNMAVASAGMPAPSVAGTSQATPPVRSETPPPPPVTSATTGNAADVHTEAPKPAPVTSATTGDGVNVRGAATTAGSGSARSAPPITTVSGQWDAASMQAASARALASLSQLSGTAFDRAYIEHEAALHRSLLQTLDGSLLPSAGDARLRDLLTTMRPKVQAHLAAAEQLLSTLGS